MPGYRNLSRLALVGAGLIATLLYYLLFAQPFPLVTLWSVRFMDLGKLTGYSRTGALVFASGMAVLFFLYLASYRAAGREGNSRLALAMVLGLALLQGLVLAATYPVGALDEFAYVFQGRVLAHYQANPFLMAPVSYPQDPMVPLLAWPNEPSTYGPLWVLVQGLAALWYGESMLAGLVVFKLLGIACYLATGYLVYLVLEQQGSPASVAGALLFAWNPLLLWETAANGHNDIAMALLALAALYALGTRRGWLAYPLLMASAMVKFITLVLYPAFLMGWLASRQHWRARLAAALTGLGLSVLLATALYAPFWVGLETIGLLRRGDLFTASPMAVLFHALSASGWANAGPVVRLLGGGLFALFVLIRSARVSEGSAETARGSFDVLFAYFVLATFWFQPWYLVVLLPFALVANDARRRNLGVMFTASAVLNYLVFDYLWLWYPDVLGLLQVQALAGACIYGPPLVYLLWLLARRGLGRKEAGERWCSSG